MWYGSEGPKTVLDSTVQATNMIHQAFPDVPVFPVLGNNDLPGPYTLPNETSSWYQSLLVQWAPLILCSQCPKEVLRPTDMTTLRSTFLDGGYYNVSIAGKQKCYLCSSCCFGRIAFSFLINERIYVLKPHEKCIFFNSYEKNVQDNFRILIGSLSYFDWSS